VTGMYDKVPWEADVSWWFPDTICAHENYVAEWLMKAIDKVREPRNLGS